VGFSIIYIILVYRLHYLYFITTTTLLYNYIFFCYLLLILLRNLSLCDIEIQAHVMVFKP